MKTRLQHLREKAQLIRRLNANSRRHCDHARTVIAHAGDQIKRAEELVARLRRF